MNMRHFQVVHNHERKKYAAAYFAHIAYRQTSPLYRESCDLFDLLQQLSSSLALIIFPIFLIPISNIMVYPNNLDPVEMQMLVAYILRPRHQLQHKLVDTLQSEKR